MYNNIVFNNFCPQIHIKKADNHGDKTIENKARDR